MLSSFYLTGSLGVALYVLARLGCVKTASFGTALVFCAMASGTCLFNITWDTVGFLICAGGMASISSLIPSKPFQKKNKLRCQRGILFALLCGGASFFIPGQIGLLERGGLALSLMVLTGLFPLFYKIPYVPCITGWAWIIGGIGIASLKLIPDWEVASLFGGMIGMTALLVGGHKRGLTLGFEGTLMMGFVFAFLGAGLLAQHLYLMIGIGYAYYLLEGALSLAITYYKTGDIWPLEQTQTEKRFLSTPKSGRFYRHFFWGMLMFSVFGAFLGMNQQTPSLTFIMVGLGITFFYMFKGFQPVPYKRVTYAQVWGDMVSGLKVLGQEAKKNLSRKK